MSAGAAGDSASLLKFIRRGRSFSGREPHCVYLNSHTPPFADVSSACGLNLTDDGRAVAPVDWDTDGDLDFWIVNRNGPQLRFMQNRLPANSKFIAVKLEGTQCNRDAIGARVELVRAGQPPMVRTLRAGDGYLAQSSKWLHFGLAGYEAIDALVIRWPDNTEETIRDLSIGRRYAIKQGAGAASVWNAPRKSVSFAGGPIPNVGKDEVHVRSYSHVPVPALRFKDERGRQKIATPVGGKQYLVINLWAGWCGPCLQELGEWSEREEELRAAGIDVLALSVSALDTKSTESQSGASLADDLQILDRLAFKFQRGAATEELVETLQVVNNHLFDLHLPLPIPTSVLLDPDGYLVAIYKGGVSVDRLIHDTRSNRNADEGLRLTAGDFQGQWNEPLNKISMVPMLVELIDRGLLDEADNLVRRLTAARKERLLPALVRLGMAYYGRGEWNKAQEHLAVAVKIDNSFVGVELALARQREIEGRFASAVKLYREALRRSPTNVSAHNRLAWLLATCSDDTIRSGQEAVDLANRAVQHSRGKDAAIMDTLATAYAEVGRFEEARKTAQRAASLARSKGQLALAGDIEGHLALFEKSQPYRSKPNAQR